MYNVWQLVREVDELTQYFQDLNNDQFPDRRFMFSIFSTLRLNDLQKMISNVRNNRATKDD